MDEIKIGQIRKWKRDTNHEHFKIVEDDGIYCDTRYWIIQYNTDGRKQTKTNEELLNLSILCDDDI